MIQQCMRCSAIVDGDVCSCSGRLFKFVDVPSSAIDRDGRCDPVSLDLEAIHIASPGKYEIDLKRLSEQQLLITKMGHGRYHVDLAAKK